MASYKFLASTSAWGAPTINLGSTYYLGKLIGSHNCWNCGDVHLEYSLDCSGYTRLTSSGVSTWQANNFSEAVMARCVSYPVPSCGGCNPPAPSLSVYEYLHCNTLTASTDKTSLYQNSQFTISGNVKDQYGTVMSGQIVNIKTYVGGGVYTSYTVMADINGNYSKTINASMYQPNITYEVRVTSDACSQSMNVTVYGLNIWLDGWTRRRRKIVDGTLSGPQNNYQMKLTIHKGAGMDGPNDVFLGGNCRDDFGDVRFAAWDGTTPINYWIEPTSVVVGDRALFWIKIDTVTASTSSMYIYYNNPSQTTTSSLANTFNPETDFSMFSANWKYSGVMSGVVTGWESPLTQFGYDTSAWTTLAVNGMPQTTATPSRFFFRKEFFLLPGSIQFSGGVDDQDVWTIIRSDNTYTKIGGNENSVICCAYSFTDTFTPPSEGRYIWVGRGSNGTTPYGIIYINAINSGLYNIYERTVAPIEPTFGTSGIEQLNMTATLMTLDKTFCIGPCPIAAGVEWQNFGTADIIYRPTIEIDYTILAYGTTNIIIPANGGKASGLATTPILSAGTHTICPYPN